uniref:NADH-ubiquinone oxidoreductase chain 5 n=1 Tax=Hariotina sp. MMOGRB0030F TaxID=1867922 RepID=A0A1D6Z2G6_9CHLO|nr:NADH dehydrogenase subunit 5 [Hariotina sp. MMOGRB0030F]
MYLSAVLAPFLGSALSGLMGRWLGSRGSGCVTVIGLGTSAFLSYRILYEIRAMGSAVVIPLGNWFGAHTVNVDWFLCFDALSASIMVTVSTVSFCVHIYSLGYMQQDPHLPRFLCYLSLFTGSMLLLVTANDLRTLMVGWEMIGVCSYLLIGFWFHRLSRTKAAQKAMLVNRISDTVLLLGLFLCWWYLGSTDTSLLTATSTTAYYADWIALRLLGGALGKSAQIGLHVWLADRMEGPTPVSALIHAATLVTAGIFLIRRTNRIWENSSMGRTLLLWVGAVTSMMRRTMGLVQNDVKRVIAYSTCSQLGYMVVALSLSHYALAMYHLMTHACFKALLFLSAGVVIHGCADVQDMRRSGGAHSALPLAWTTLLLGSLSLLGWPFLAGYYSKDAILELSWATPGATAAYGHLILMTVATLTSAYSFRVLIAVFYAPRNARKTELRIPGVPFTMVVPLCILAFRSIFRGYLLSDGLIGWGTSLWGNSIVTAPGTSYAVRSHMIPVWVAALPLVTVFLGAYLAYVFIWPLPYCAESYWKKAYLFLQTRWGFDLVWNQQISIKVLQFGSICWASIDKGILELFGPRGISQKIMGWRVPSVQKMQTGAVHDYALLLQILVAVGLLLLAYPRNFLPYLFSTASVDLGGAYFLKTRTMAVLLILLSL